MQGMAMVQKMGGKVVGMFSDSRLVVGQVTGEMEAKDVRMQEYLNQVKRLRPSFDLFSLSHIARSGNTHADSLATLATSSAGQFPQIILVEHLGGASKVAKNTTRVHETRVGSSWMDSIVAFLKDDILPEAKLEAEKIRRNDQSYCWKSYTKGSAVVTQGEDPCRTEPLPRVIGGRGCRRKLWSML